MMLKVKALLLFGGLAVATVSFSQQHKTFSYGGIVISTPAYFGNVTANHAKGLGVEFQREQFFNKRFSWTLDVGYSLFKGTYTFPTFSYPRPDSTINRFSVVPILGGLRLYYCKQWYAGFDVGVTLVSFGAGLDPYPAAVPCIGYKINAEKKHSLDLNLRLLNVLGYPTFPENNNLAAGGYGIWGLKIGYGF